MLGKCKRWLIRFNRVITADFFICGHGQAGGGVRQLVLCVQVSGAYKALVGIDAINHLCQDLATLRSQIWLTSQDRMLMENTLRLH